MGIGTADIKVEAADGKKASVSFKVAVTNPVQAKAKGIEVSCKYKDAPYDYKFKVADFNIKTLHKNNSDLSILL